MTDSELHNELDNAIDADQAVRAVRQYEQERNWHGSGGLTPDEQVEPSAYSPDDYGLIVRPSAQHGLVMRQGSSVGL